MRDLYDDGTILCLNYDGGDIHLHMSWNGYVSISHPLTHKWVHVKLNKSELKLMTEPISISCCDMCYNYAKGYHGGKCWKCTRDLFLLHLVTAYQAIIIFKEMKLKSRMLIKTFFILPKHWHQDKCPIKERTYMTVHWVITNIILCLWQGGYSPFSKEKKQDLQTIKIQIYFC